MLFEAGLMNVIRTLLILVLIYYGFKLLVRFLFPILIKRFINKQANNFNGNFQDQQKKPDGDVHVNSTTKQNSKTDQLGDYVEYEEVE